MAKKNEIWRTWHNAYLDKSGGAAPITNNEQTAFVFDGEIWQAGEVRRIPIDRAFEMYAFEGRGVSVNPIDRHRCADPMIEHASKVENRRIAIEGNEDLPSVVKALARYAVPPTDYICRDRDYYIIDDPSHITAHVLHTFDDFMSGRIYAEGENVPMYPEEYERARLLGLACQDGARMKANIDFLDRLAWNTGIDKSWEFGHLANDYFITTPSHADELESQGLACSVSDDEWDTHHVEPKSIYFDDQNKRIKAAIHGSNSHLIVGYAG